MPPKGKGGKKGKKKEPENENAMPEVDKTFYELSIAELNRKIVRLTTDNDNLLLKNSELETKLIELDEDRNDVIVYLKRILQERSDEIFEVKERLKALEETRNNEIEQYEARIKDNQEEYRVMHEQLTSEIKLLDGKLSALDEFRLQRADLMLKYEQQEVAMAEQEVRHKNELYEIERKFIIAKDNLKKDMETRLLQLSTEFNDATEIRIAATTHRVIRENVAINNELDLMLKTHTKLYNESSKLKEMHRISRQEAELHEAEKKQALHKAKIQSNIIERLTSEYEEMKKKLEKYKDIEEKSRQLQSELIKAKDEILNLKHAVRLLEQNLHASRTNRTYLETKLQMAEDDYINISTLLMEVAIVIKNSLNIQQQVDVEESLKQAEKDRLFSTLLNTLSALEENKFKRSSLTSVESLTATYELGDLGFVPKPVVIRSRLPVRHNIQSQVGSSFEQLLQLAQMEESEGSSREMESLDLEEEMSLDKIVEEIQKQTMFSMESFESADDEERVIGGDSGTEEESEESTAGLLLPTRSAIASKPPLPSPTTDGTEEVQEEEVIEKENTELEKKLSKARANLSKAAILSKEQIVEPEAKTDETENEQPIKTDDESTIPVSTTTMEEETTVDIVSEEPTATEPTEEEDTDNA